MTENTDLAIDADQLLSKIGQWKAAEKSRAEGAGETREDIGEFIEATGLNKKALSHMRAADKLSESKRGDYLRSLHALLDVFEPHWRGQSTPDMIDSLSDPDETTERHLAAV